MDDNNSTNIYNHTRDKEHKSTYLYLFLNIFFGGFDNDFGSAMAQNSTSRDMALHIRYPIFSNIKNYFTISFLLFFIHI